MAIEKKALIILRAITRDRRHRGSSQAISAVERSISTDFNIVKARQSTDGMVVQDRLLSENVYTETGPGASPTSHPT